MKMVMTLVTKAELVALCTNARKEVKEKIYPMKWGIPVSPPSYKQSTKPVPSSIAAANQND